MKHNYLKSLFLMLMMCVGMSAWAEDADYTLTPTAGSNNTYTDNCDVTVGDITWNITGNATMVPWRLGGKSITKVDRTVYSKTAYTSAVSKVDLTVGAASSITVNSLKLVYSTNSDFSNSSETKGEFAANSTISFEADFPANAYYKFVFNVTVSGSSNKFVEFKKVEFYNKGDGGDTDPDPTTITAPTFSPVAGTYTGAQTITLTQSDASMIMYTTDGTDPSYENEVGKTYDAPFQISSSCTVKAIAIDDDGNESEVASAEYIIKKDPTNTQATAYTVAEVKSIIDNVEYDLTKQVYVKGFVSEIVTAWSNQYNNITYNISEDGSTTGNQFQLYRCATNGAELGDNVIAYGTLYKHNDTYEFNAGNTIVDIQKPAAKTITALEVSGTPTKTTYNVGDAFETAGLTVTATYSDNTTATITEGFDWEIDYGTGNEALVAGATSVGVMVYTEDQEVMSEVYTVNGLTVTVPVTLTSIAVSGTPTKTAYYAGDAFETAGLVVTGHYSDGSDKEITEGIEWTNNPETLTLGTTSVNVKAGVGSVVSEVYTINGLTVTKPDFETVTYNFSSFESNSSVEFTILDDFVITLVKGQSSNSNPAWNSNQAKLYAGGSLTVKANNAVIKSIEYDYTVNANSKGVTPTIDGVEGKTNAGTWDTENKTWTGADEEVTFSTSGTAGNVGFTKLIIKYVEKNLIETSLAWSATEATVTIGADDNVFPTLTTTPVDLDGITFKSSNTEVATIAADGTITLVKAGETTITANYAGDAEHKAATPASYTLTVNKAPFVPTPAAKGYETVDFAALYSSVTTNATVEEYEGTSFAMAFAKPQSSTTPTKYYNIGKSVRAYEGNTITIDGAEKIMKVSIAWTKEKGEDKEVTIEGLESKTVVVTFANTCSFSSITVHYGTEISISSAGYATYYTDKAFVMPAGLKGLTVSANDGGNLTLAEKYQAKKVVPANTPLILKGEQNTYTLTYTNETGADAGENYLRGKLTSGMIEAESGDYYYYKLTTGPSSNSEYAGKLGFYWGEANGGVFEMKNDNRAYLVLPKSANVKAFTFDDFETAIQSVETNKYDTKIFNLQGQRVSKAQKGIFIMNGKKVVR